MSRFAELSKGRREYLQAFWPANPQLGRPDPIPLKLQVLTDEEFQEAIAAAHERLRLLKLDGRGELAVEDVENEISIQLLARACRDDSQPATVAFCVDADDLRRHTTPWERGEVGAVWKDFQERRNPQRELTERERQEVEAAIKKKAAMTLRAFGPDTLVSFMLTSASPPSN